MAAATNLMELEREGAHERDSARARERERAQVSGRAPTSTPRRQPPRGSGQCRRRRRSRPRLLRPQRSRQRQLDFRPRLDAIELPNHGITVVAANQMGRAPYSLLGGGACDHSRS
eukprot:62774-Pleurochrysis_carterae.AAC.3